MANQIQIIGTLKCRNTQKVIRYFKDRGLTPHFLDLNQKALSKGELNNITRSITIEYLIDKDSKEYKKKNLQYMVYDSSELILENPLIIKTPITRFGSKSIQGFDTAKLESIVNELKQ